MAHLNRHYYRYITSLNNSKKIFYMYNIIHSNESKLKLILFLYSFKYIYINYYEYFFYIKRIISSNKGIEKH